MILSCNLINTLQSSLSEEDSTLEFDGKIDLGKHLALLHLHLADALAKLNTQVIMEIDTEYYHVTLKDLDHYMKIRKYHGVYTD